MKQNIIFGIDVSSKSSTICVVIDRIPHEATGIYSLSLQAFLEDYHIKYLKLNPLRLRS